MWPPSAIISSDVKDGLKAPVHQLARDFWLRQKQDENLDERCVVCEKRKTSSRQLLSIVFHRYVDNAHQIRQKSRRKSQPALKGKSAQPPLGCVDLSIF